MPNYLATFFTHSGAIYSKRLWSSHEINVELVPVPRKVSSNCGIGIMFKYDKNVLDLINEEVEAMFEVDESSYREIYRSDN